MKILAAKGYQGRRYRELLLKDALRLSLRAP